MSLPRLVLVVLCARLAHCTQPPAGCVIELECAECIPEHMPAVAAAAGGAVRLAEGEALALECPGGAFLAFPERRSLSAVCAAGRYRVLGERDTRHLLELGCQEDIFEDVLHQVEGCAPPLQGRVYRTQAAGGVRHVAALCWDPERALALRAWAGAGPLHALALPPHSDRLAPLSLLGNFNHMFDLTTRHDAERLYGDEVRLNRRLRELFKHDDFPFADQKLTSVKLLSEQYFVGQSARVTDFVSNRVAAWGSVARGNLRLVQRAVGGLLRARRSVQVTSGALGSLALATARGPRPVHLRAGGRFPVPKYIWTLVHDPSREEALVVIVLNDPFVALDDAEGATLCPSVCPRASWLGLRGARVPLLGLAACCSLAAAAEHIPALPALRAHNLLLTEL